MVDAEEDCMFFKVLLDDFNEKLRLSERLVRREKWRRLNLTTALGGKKKVWSVEIQEDSGGIFHLTGDGWRSFVQDHDLLFGYFLVFIYRANMSFYVIPFDLSGFRKSYKPIDGTTMDDLVISEKKKSKDDGKLKMKKKKKSVEKNLKVQKKPQFKITMQPSYIDKRLMHFPNNFRDANNLSTINEAILTNTNGRWPVKVCHTLQNGNINSVFSAGWSAFLRENNLKEGDVCIFELSSKDDNSANFIVTKEGSKEVEFCRKEGHSKRFLVGNDDDKLKMEKKMKTVEKYPKVQKKTQFKNSMKPSYRQCMVSRRKDNSNGRNLSRKDNSNVLAAGRNLSRPHFEVTITKNHLFGKTSQVHIPVIFGGLHYLHDKSRAMLKKSLNGKSWEVAVVEKQPAENQIYHKFGKGWKEFCHDNELEERDVCSFELISKEGDDDKLEEGNVFKFEVESSKKDVVVLRFCVLSKNVL